MTSRLLRTGRTLRYERADLPRVRGEFREAAEEHLRSYRGPDPMIVVETKCGRCGARFSLSALAPLEADALEALFDSGLAERLKNDALKYRKEQRTCCGKPAGFHALILLCRASLTHRGREKEVAVAFASGARGERLLLVRRRNGTVEAPEAVGRFFLLGEVDYVY